MQGGTSMSDNNTCCSKSKSGFTCPLTGFNFCFNSNFTLAATVMIVWLNLFSWFWHGNVMKARYIETALLWRPEAEMKAWAITLGISLSAFIATYVFAKGFEGKGIKEGLRFGILITLLFSSGYLIAHATQPIPEDIIGMWIIGDFLGYSLGSILLGYVLKKDKCCNE
jgi:hypothetical protein